ncbi:MAG TPA: nucleotidyltransferase domain-containing protein [Candidatus Limnocylindria bacterium]|nr:nucleotidyltransferase domain-containing protein [Candidatus Limnocylindria bacterium]
MTNRELPPYPSSTILVVEVGSTAHGTGLPGREDHDEIVIYVEPPEVIFGPGLPPRAAQIRTQPEGVPSGPGDTDRSLYSLRHFLYLAASGNPSILMVLWAPVINATALGTSLRDLGPAFVGRHLVPKYRGYMKAQRDRLLGLRGGRHGKLRHDETGVGFDTKYAMHAARLGYQGVEILTTRALSLPIAGAPGDWLREVRGGKVPLDAVVARIEALDEQLDELGSDASISAGPDRSAIAAWSAAAHRQAWGWPPDKGKPADPGR